MEPNIFFRILLATALVCMLVLMGLNAMAGPLAVGVAAPDFTAQGDDGKTFKLAEQIGKRPVVLFFYPKDGTPGCTKEVCSVRDAFPELRRLDVTVVGMSYDSVKSHGKFSAKHSLPFTLLSDPDGAIAKLYGAYRRFFAYRMTFIVGLDGKIAYVNPSVDPAAHGPELVKALAGLATVAPWGKPVLAESKTGH